MGWLSRLLGREAKKVESMKTAQMSVKSQPMEHPSMSPIRITKDPVCGIEIDERKAVATSLYKGQTYYFCAMGCKKSFDQNPGKYTMGTREMKGGMHH